MYYDRWSRHQRPDTKKDNSSLRARALKKLGLARRFRSREIRHPHSAGGSGRSAKYCSTVGELKDISLFKYTHNEIWSNLLHTWHFRKCPKNWRSIWLISCPNFICRTYINVLSCLFYAACVFPAVLNDRPPFQCVRIFDFKSGSRLHGLLLVWRWWLNSSSQFDRVCCTYHHYVLEQMQIVILIAFEFAC